MKSSKNRSNNDLILAHPCPWISKKRKWIISEVVHTNTTIFTSYRKIGTNDLNIFFGTDLRGGFPEQMAFKTEKIDLDREASSKKCVQTWFSPGSHQPSRLKKLCNLNNKIRQEMAEYRISGISPWWWNLRKTDRKFSVDARIKAHLEVFWLDLYRSCMPSFFNQFVNLG